MNIMIVIVAVAAIAAIYLLRKQAGRNVPAPSRVSYPHEPQATHPSPRAVDAILAPVVPVQGPTMPESLEAFCFIDRASLSVEHRQDLVAKLRRIPKPPLSLYKLVSPEFLDNANSNQISHLIMGEALIAAKLLARVNSPFYALRRPVISIGQALTFLGLNGVRSICLKYMLNESFKAGNDQRKQIIGRVMGASALAGELCASLSQRLDLPEQGSLVTQVVLSFLGRFATASLMPIDCNLWTAENGLLERSSAEQAQLGLSATEIGSLLMQEWGLPATLIEEVRDIDRVLVMPAEALESSRGARLALCYLCARLGERLALGSLNDLAHIDLATEPSAEFFHLRSYLDSPGLARLPEYLHSTELVKSINQMQLAILKQH